MDSKIVRIVPSPDGPNALGTEVFVGDEKLSVQKLTLVADADSGKWRATIECLAIVDGEIVAEIESGR